MGQGSHEVLELSEADIRKTTAIVRQLSDEAKEGSEQRRPMVGRTTKPN